jgi:hypothetical protein
MSTVMDVRVPTYVRITLTSESLGTSSEVIPLITLAGGFVTGSRSSFVSEECRLLGCDAV